MEQVKQIGSLVKRPLSKVKEVITAEKHTDPDVIAFNHIGTVALFAALFTFGIAWFCWNGFDRIYFAYPALPKMTGCETLNNYFDGISTQVPDIVQPYLEVNQAPDEDKQRDLRR